MEFESKTEANLWLVDILASSNWWLAPQGKEIFKSVREANLYLADNPDIDLLILAPVSDEKSVYDCLLTTFNNSDSWTLQTAHLMQNASLSTSSSELLSGCHELFELQYGNRVAPPVLSGVSPVH